MMTPSQSILARRAKVHALFMKMAEIMAEQDLPYYNSVTEHIRHEIEEIAGITIVYLKGPGQSTVNGYSVDDMSKEEQLMLVLFAAELVIQGDFPVVANQEL